jgi:hypothetical protein
MKDIKMDNEKIKILAEQCIAEGQFAVGDFTKSIIDECLLALDNAEKPHVHTTFDQGQHESSIAEAKKAIKNYFGII